MRTPLLVVQLLFSSVVYPACLPDQSLSLGSSLEQFDQTYIESDLVPPEIDSQYSEREIPAELLCPDDPAMREGSLRLLYIDRQLATMIFERIGKEPLWEEWIASNYGHPQKEESGEEGSHSPSRHFTLQVGDQAIRYFRMAIDAGDTLERIEIENPAFMQNRWNQLLNEEAMGR